MISPVFPNFSHRQKYITFKFYILNAETGYQNYFNFDAALKEGYELRSTEAVPNFSLVELLVFEMIEVYSYQHEH